jgi:hypothetical protein
MEGDKLSRRHFLTGAGATALSTQFTSPQAGDSVDQEGWVEGNVCSERCAYGAGRELPGEVQLAYGARKISVIVSHC